MKPYGRDVDDIITPIRNLEEGGDGKLEIAADELLLALLGRVLAAECQGVGRTD